jgi:hypothetical protein
MRERGHIRTVNAIAGEARVKTHAILQRQAVIRDLMD